MTVRPHHLPEEWKCENCAWWSGKSSCRVRSPTKSDGYGYAVFPSSDSNDWCAEFTSIENFIKALKAKGTPAPELRLRGRMLDIQ